LRFVRPAAVDGRPSVSVRLHDNVVVTWPRVQTVAEHLAFMHTICRHIIYTQSIGFIVRDTRCRCENRMSCRIIIYYNGPAVENPSTLAGRYNNTRAFEINSGRAPSKILRHMTNFATAIVMTGIGPHTGFSINSPPTKLRVPVLCLVPTCDVMSHTTHSSVAV